MVVEGIVGFTCKSEIPFSFLRLLVRNLMRLEAQLISHCWLGILMKVRGLSFLSLLVKALVALA